MTDDEVRRLTQIHQTLGLIHQHIGLTLAPDLEALFAAALEELFDLLAELDPDNLPEPGAEWPDDDAARWRSMR